MEKVIVVGAGVSGLSIAHQLSDRYEVTVLEKADRPGGLVKCDRVNGHLYHKVGGHVFNTKRQDVLDWFWKFFDRDNEFTKADRNSVVSMEDGKWIPYPIENHAYMFNEDMMKGFITDLVSMARAPKSEPKNFEEFLRTRFGKTLYQVYFQPYNEKVWRRSLKHVPLSWLAGKLPMPTLEEMIYNKFKHIEEKAFVHSSFYYEKKGGSQFLANRLAEGLNIQYNVDVNSIEKTAEGWKVNGIACDKVVFCGNIKDLPSILIGINISDYNDIIGGLESHGTTSVLCEIDDNPYSWIYMPSRQHQSHRIICTGNFSPTNRNNGIMSATIEFTDYISKEDILDNLKRIPLHPKYITHEYTQYTYPIQDENTRSNINSLKKVTEASGLYLLGRFAEWEYYNMDAAMGAALDLNKRMA